METALTAVTRASTCAVFLALLVTGARAETPVTAKGKAFNPDIGINFLTLWQHGTGLSNDRTQFNPNGLQLQEAEVQFSADVDPYFRAVALFSVAPSGGEFQIDPEEVYAETLSLPQITFRAGKFKLAMGKHNQLHTHAFPFIDAPLINQQLLGAEEGLNEPAVSAAWLAPASWYSELLLQAYNPSDAFMFGGQSGDIGGLARLKNLFDLSEDLTLEFGLSGTAAQNAARMTGTVVGSDLTFKWRPTVGGKYQALIWQSEYLQGFRVPVGTATDDARLGGIASWLQYQFAERWWIQGRVEHVGWPTYSESAVQNKQSALLGFFPSEFSGFRLQYDHIRSQLTGHQDDHTLALQFNVSIGAHPAHAY